MEIINSKVVHENPIFRVEEREVLVSGGDKQTHWVVIRKPGVQVVALNRQGKIVLLKELREPSTEFTINLPGGKVEQLETEISQLQERALKELEEEVGYRAGGSDFLMKESRSTHWLERDFYIFVAWDLEFVGPKPEPGERVMPFAVSEREIEIMAGEGELPDYLRTILKRAMGYFQEKGLL